MTMPRAPRISLLPDRRRLHLQDGPIDLIVEAFGGSRSIAMAYEGAIRRFHTILDELCTELGDLRAPAEPAATHLAGAVARRMYEAVRPHAGGCFITPMAAVAGSVADEVLVALVAAGGDGLTRAYVNNGGDIALYLTEGTRFVTGLVDRPDRPALFAKAVIEAHDRVGGIATSGAPGRSFSLGIADAVTVLAADAASADGAATVIANAVDLPRHPGIIRVPADTLQPDTDLRDRLVTRHVPPLDVDDIATALEAGLDVADRLVATGLIHAAALNLQGLTRFSERKATLIERAVSRETGAGADRLPRSSPQRQGDLHA